MSECDRTCSAMVEWRSEHLGRVRFTREAEPALDKVQPACETAQSALDRSDLESRLRELAKPSSELLSDLALEPRVTLAHDPNDPLALLEQLNRHNTPGPIDRPISTNAVSRPMPFLPARPASRSIPSNSAICHRFICTAAGQSLRHQIQFASGRLNWV
jgi:hypothetical protein